MMKKALVFTTLLFLLASCGGDEETNDPTVVEGGKETHTSETVVQNPIDSTILNEYMKLLQEMQSQDSTSFDLEKKLDELTKGNDSLKQMLLSMQDTLDVHFPVEFPVDDTDYDFPPNGDTSTAKYKLFNNLVPDKGKDINLIPKEYRGFFANSNKASVTIDEKSIIYKSATGEESTIFYEGKQKCRQVGDYLLLLYDIGGKWVVVTIEVKSDNLAFRIIPESSSLKDDTSTKDWKKDLEDNRRKLYQIFNKVK